ncbi:phage integrase SAM-like domain-containing protein [Guyparkeria sp. GHLCS8-2]|uniref:phage integrase SAM-like domain-containing protein n=1 Tax=Guyparkeria halopsychrophila TaxID=3139421 RepID=UPI0037CC5B75
MPKKKLRFPPIQRPAKVGNDETLKLESLPPAETTVWLPENATSSRGLDFDKHYGQGCDVVVYAAQRVVDKMARDSLSSDGRTLSPATIGAYFHQGMRHFLPFCAVMASALRRELELDDIDREFIDLFVAHLAQSDASKQTQRTRYRHAKSVLFAMGQSGWLAKDIFPRNPYPNANRLHKGDKPLSEPEYKKVIRAINTSLQAILTGSGPLTSRELVTCLMGIIVRTGINPSPALELRTDCLSRHPVKSDRYVLTSFKRRGNATHIQSLRRTSDIESIVNAVPKVAEIIDHVRDRNASIRQASRYPDLLFVYESRGGGQHHGNLCRLSGTFLNTQIHAFVDRHQLLDADGQPLQLNATRLRTTFVNRLFDLSGGNPVLTAELAGHTPKVSNDHYLEAPESAEKDWRLMGEVRTDELLNQGKIEQLPTENTPVAKCQDTLHGRFAPGNGNEHCQQFLACFRCPHFVVTGEDLYRVYSLYWILVRMRNKLGAKRWAKIYRHIIRIIDNEIAPQFDDDQVRSVRERARVDPHPFWRDPEMLGSEYVA